jgi:hypothetical protein
MKLPVIPLVCMILLFSFPLSGEAETPEEPQAPEEGPVFFPVNALLAALRAPDLRWQPDWPLIMPPDAFVVGQGRPRSITLILDSGELRMTRNRDTVPTDFPFWFQGNFIQVHVVLGETGTPRELIMDDALRSWHIEFLEGDDSPLCITRITQGEEVFFGAIQRGPPVPQVSAGDIETWYDREGQALVIFTYLPGTSGERPGFRYIKNQNDAGETEVTTYYHDGFGNISGIDSPLGSFSAGYIREGRPRYGERRILIQPAPATEEGEEPAPSEFYQSYAFQWDERGFLVRITGTPGTGTGGSGDEDPVDFRYDYTLDEQGNWIERREIRMIPRFGMLIPRPGSRITRTIVYEPED